MGLTILGGATAESYIFQGALSNGINIDTLRGLRLTPTELLVYDVISLLKPEEKKDFWILYQQGYVTVEGVDFGLKGDIWSYFVNNLTPEEFRSIYLLASRKRETVKGVREITE